MSTFGRYSTYYDAFYDDKDYEGEARFVHRILRMHTLRIESILDLGCGTGAHARHFVDLGCRVHGVDVSSQMVDRARAHVDAIAPVSGAESPAFSVADIRFFRTEHQFDAVTALFHVMSYQNTYEDLYAVFRTAKTHLRPGGIFLFDFWYGPAVLHDLPVPRTKRWENETVQVIRLAEPVLHTERNVVDVRYTIWEKEAGRGMLEEIRETHHMRYWFLPELAFFLTEAGFDIRETGEWMTAAVPSLTSWSVYLAAAARA